MASAGMREPAQRASSHHQGGDRSGGYFGLLFGGVRPHSLPRRFWRGPGSGHASCFSFHMGLRHASTGATLGPVHLQTRQWCAGPPQSAAASFIAASPAPLHAQRQIQQSDHDLRYPRGFSGEEQSSIAPDQARETPFLKPFSAACVTPGMRRDDVNCPGGNGGSRRIALAPRSGEAGELKLCDSLPMGAVQGSNAVASRPNVPGKAVRIGRPRGGMAIRPSFQTTRSAAPKAAIPARFITEISERYRNIRNRILFT